MTTSTTVINPLNCVSYNHLMIILIILRPNRNQPQQDKVYISVSLENLPTIFQGEIVDGQKGDLSDNFQFNSIQLEKSKNIFLPFRFVRIVVY